MIKTLLSEDHSLVRAGLRALLERSGDIHVVGEASNGQEAIELTRELKPSVLVMDVMMPRLNGIQAAQQIRELKLPVRILLLSMYSDEGLIRQALQSGVNGYMLKTSVGDELRLAIRKLAHGETYLSPQIPASVLETAFHPDGLKITSPLDHLSPREKEILQLIVEEHTSLEIANLLSISEKTVEKHRAHLMEKLKVRNLAGLVRLAIRHGLVDKN
jgi:NarL family two-component system response regulator LiaR